MDAIAAYVATVPAAMAVVERMIASSSSMVTGFKNFFRLAFLFFFLRLSKLHKVHRMHM